MHQNIYFELTEVFNREERIVVLGSGQAVVWHRLAIMSKDGDWIVRETDEACAAVRDTLATLGARYRVGAPLDPRWLAGGWSSHFELEDERGRRVRCDFFSRPPRVSAEEVDRLFAAPEPVVGIEPLIAMKQTQRAKDYAVVGELARRLPPARELQLTTDVDRILALAPCHPSDRPAAVAARQGDRREVVRALADEIDELQRVDRDRLAAYEVASAAYVRSMARLDRRALALPGGHGRVVALAEELLPLEVGR